VGGVWGWGWVEVLFVLWTIKNGPPPPVRGVACIQDLSSAHPGFAPYFTQIRCPEVCCVHPSKRHLKLWVLLPGFNNSHRVIKHLFVRGYTIIRIDRNHSSCNLNPNGVGGWVILCCKTPVATTKVQIQMLVFSDLKTDARKGHF